MKSACGAGSCEGNAKDQAEVPDPDPLDPRDPPPDDRYCDVVLTGGVTDGVVYPWAMVELARKYRFKNISGTSVGAMAAALTAASEYGRRYGSLVGFNEVLLKLPRKLGEDVDGMTRLFSLFQTAKSTRRLFKLFVGLVEIDSGADRKSALRRILLPARKTGNECCIGRIVPAARTWIRSLIRAGLRTRKTCTICKLVLKVLLVRRACGVCGVVSAALRAYRVPALLGVLGGLLIGIAVWWYWHFGSAWALLLTLLVSAVPCALVLMVLLAGLRLYLDLEGGFVKNGFGLCTGYRTNLTPPGQQSLVEWLHEGIQAAAGKTLDQPLTFKDLWNAPGGPLGHSLPPTRQTRKSRSIDLRMVTTNLTHSRPYALPLDDQTSRLFYNRKELSKYFPDTILDYLDAHSVCYAPRDKHDDPDQTPQSKAFRELPGGDLPIVVATRLSLSFPVLFSAVPLYAIDYEPGPRQDRKLRRCWYSDGGICSNFPIHMFDSALPRWPTFGISLGRRSPFWSEERTWLPKFYNDGRGDRWDRFDDEIQPVTGERLTPVSRLLGFVFSIVYSAKDWNDKTAMRMPGVRDRVVRVALERGEGGLNITLTREKIMKLARDYGQPAGRDLVAKFIGPAPDKWPSQYWNEHRWVRFHTLLVGVRERIEAFGATAELADYARSLSAQILEARLQAPLSERHGLGEALTPQQADDLEKLLAALKDLEAQFARAANPQAYRPLPTPVMRLRTPL